MSDAQDPMSDSLNLSQQKPLVLVILKSSAAALKGTEAFLKNRGVTVLGTHQLREALAFIIQKHPNFIMIGADHANKKVKMLPKLLNQAFHIPVIGFTESSSNMAVAKLHELGLEYHLYPPISGPAVERMLAKIQKDEETRAKESNHLSARSGLAESSPTEASTLDSAKSALQALISGNDLDSNSEGDLSESDIYIQKGQAGEKFSHTQEGGAFVSDWKPKEGPEKNKGKLIMPESSSGVPSALIIPSPGPNRKNTSFGNEDSIILRGTQNALEETVTIKGSAPEDNIQPIEKSSNMACLEIKSSQFSGYLVAALGNDRQIDEQFMTLIKERLFAFLRNHGELIEESGASMNLKLEHVEFEDWALDQAEFLRKSVHGDHEIAMAFFPSPDTKVQLETSARENMFKMGMDEIRDNTTVEFDLYIYMPENDKFLLYTPEGQTIYGEQKNRLKKKGITHIHLRKEKAGDVKRYKAKLFLSDQISAFKNKKAQK